MTRRPTFNRAKAQAEKDARYRRALAEQRERIEAKEQAETSAPPPAAPPAPTRES